MSSLDFSKLPDISDWERLPDTSILGTRDKKVLRVPQNKKLCFIKFPKEKAIEPIQQLEIITEHIATEIAKSFGIEAHDCYPAIYQGKLGINNLMLVQDKTDYHLVYPKQLIKEDLRLIEQDMPGEKDYTRYRQLHTVDNVLDTFFQYCTGYEGFFEQKFLPGFLRMCLYDALVGMTDRHWENYAILKRIYLSANQTYPEVIKGIQADPELLRAIYKAIPNWGKDKTLKFEVLDMNFAPLYDNSACLFWNIIDEKLPETDQQLLSYSTTKKAPSQIGIPDIDKVNFFELLEYLVSKTYSKHPSDHYIPLKPILLEEFDKIRQHYCPSKIEQIIDNRHYGLFSEKRRKLIPRYVDFRMKMVENILKPG